MSGKDKDKDKKKVNEIIEIDATLLDIAINDKAGKPMKKPLLFMTTNVCDRHVDVGLTME